MKKYSGDGFFGFLARRALRGFYVLLALAVVSSCASSTSVYQNPLRRAPSIARLFPQWEWFAPGIEVTRGRTVKPKLVFHALRVNLSDDRVRIVTNGQAADRGTIKSITVSNFARLSGSVAAINAGPFTPVSLKEGADKKIVGLFISEGVALSAPVARYGALLFYRDGGAAIVPQHEITSVRNVMNAVGGFDIILKEGVIPPDVLTREERHPRTAAALADGGRTLILLVIDGRQFSSEGATEADTAAILLVLGAEDGLNLDGGGSSTLVLRKEEKYQRINTPVNFLIAGKERPVATCIGITEVDAP
jgi:exopolysaccharide biosynthesis protein